MNDKEVLELIDEMLKEHGITGWKGVILTRARLRTGVCDYEKKQLGVSKVYAQHNTDVDVHDTILHEIAHIKAGPHTGHGPVWKKVATEMGIPALSKRVARMPPHDLRAVCAHCSKEFRRYRRPSRPRFCPRCYDQGKVDLPLQWERT